MKGRRHSLKVRLRAFHIWQLLGYSPWKSEWKVTEEVREGGAKDFYKGAFDSIPFLNDDGKRTFVHLLLRPGYMIRDYIKGKHDMYLAPLTSLIIFYAFFSLVSSIAHPDFEGKKEQSQVVASDSLKNNVSITLSFGDDSVKTDTDREKTVRMSQLVAVADTLIYLNRYPEAINSPKRASLAAFESALRSQGINYFLGIFLLMWPAMRIALRKQSMGWAASATASAYILCQFSFFMLFVLILSLGQKNEIGFLFMGLLVMIDYHQLLETGYRKSLWLTLKTALYIFLLFLLFLLLVGAVLVMIT